MFPGDRRDRHKLHRYWASYFSGKFELDRVSRFCFGIIKRHPYGDRKFGLLEHQRERYF